MMNLKDNGLIVTSLILGLAGLAVLALSVSGGVPVYLGLSTLALAAILLAARPLPVFLRVVIATLGWTHLVLLALIVPAALGLNPALLNDYVPPVSMPIGAAIFAGLIYGSSFIPVIRTIMRIGDAYFASNQPSHWTFPGLKPFKASEGAIGRGFLAALIGINLFQVALSVRLSFFSRDLFNALQEKDAGAFWYQLFWIFVPLAALWVLVAIVEVVLQYLLRIRWRTWLNTRYLGRWLGGNAHYHMQLVGQEADNPDQRIAEDLRKYVDQTYSLSIGLLSQSATLVSFIVILWGVSQGFTLPGTDTPVPGLLVWFAILYAILGTWLTHKIGKPLIALNFQQERFEADYRFSLARLREYGEQVALLRGAAAENERLQGRFAEVVRNYLAITDRRKKLTSFTASYFQASVVVPYIIAAPFYFAGKITLGQLQQTAGAFARVDGALTFFIESYANLADYKAVIDRLVSFESAIEHSPGSGALKVASHENGDIVMEGLTLTLPDGRTIVRTGNLKFRSKERTLLTGPSGSGKSTLFRAIAGIWPFGEGRIFTPQGDTLLLLPQRPYIPIGTLRSAVTYPAMAGAYSDAAIRTALEDAALPHLCTHLETEGHWAQSLSLGEQQRLAVARALLAKPDWLFLDEATAALDEPLEAALYDKLCQRLPNTSLVSIGHRTTLLAFHDRRIEMQAGEGGVFMLRDLEAE